MENILSADVLLSYPQVDMAKAEQLLQMEIKRSGKKIVVLDDDPTGVQTVHDVSVYTDWTEQSIRRGFEEKKPFVLHTDQFQSTYCRTDREGA